MRPTTRLAFALIGSILASALPAGTAFAQRPKDQPPVLTAFVLNGGADSILASEPSLAVAHTVVGTRPSEYRVSRRADFLGATWQAYVDRIAVRDWYDAGGPACDASRPSHRVTLYLQVRATLGEEIRVVDGQRQLVPSHVESNVMRASICARPA